MRPVPASESMQKIPEFGRYKSILMIMPALCLSLALALPLFPHVLIVFIPYADAVFPIAL